jgi:hypothetical protein
MTEDWIARAELHSAEGWTCKATCSGCPLLTEATELA